MNDEQATPLMTPQAEDGQGPVSRLGRHTSAASLATLDVDAYLADPARKQAFVTPMFDLIAPRYDDFTRLFSFGMDRQWKRYLVDEVGRLSDFATDAPLLVDLASGTGDLAAAVVRALRTRAPALHMLGIDASAQMSRAARARLHAGIDRDVADAIDVATGDMLALPVGDASAHLVTAGYGVRNTPDAAMAIQEAARVVRPGGLFISLDFYRPRFAPWRWLLLRYLALAGSIVGWHWHRSPIVYGYIAKSIDHFVSWQAYGELLELHGFRVRSVRRWLGGGVALHVAERR